MKKFIYFVSVVALLGVGCSNPPVLTKISSSNSQQIPNDDEIKRARAVLTLADQADRESFSRTQQSWPFEDVSELPKKPNNKTYGSPERKNMEDEVFASLIDGLIPGAIINSPKTIPESQPFSLKVGEEASYNDNEVIRIESMEPIDKYGTLVIKISVRTNQASQSKEALIQVDPSYGGSILSKYSFDGYYHMFYILNSSWPSRVVLMAQSHGG